MTARNASCWCGSLGFSFSQHLSVVIQISSLSCCLPNPWHLRILCILVGPDVINYWKHSGLKIEQGVMLEGSGSQKSKMGLTGLELVSVAWSFFWSWGAGWVSLPFSASGSVGCPSVFNHSWRFLSLYSISLSSIYRRTWLPFYLLSSPRPYFILYQVLNCFFVSMDLPPEVQSVSSGLFQHL